jgi:archaellum component FlaC
MAGGGAPAAGVFGCNLDAVDLTAKQLAQVHDELEHFDNRGDQHVADLASNKIQNALHHFYTDSSDQRKKVKDSVKGLRDILQGLAQGVRDIDSTLADSLPDGTSGSGA